MRDAVGQSDPHAPARALLREASTELARLRRRGTSGRRRVTGLLPVACLGLAAATWLVASSFSPAPREAAPEPGRADEHAASLGFDANPRSHWIEFVAASEYRASRTEQGLQAPNRAHGLRTWFEPTGVRVHDRSAAGGAPLVELRLVGLGRGEGTLAPVVEGDVASDGALVEIRRPGLVEWYVNAPAGLEQGFTIAERPAGEEGQLVLELAVAGAKARLEGDAVVLASARGRRLRYGGLAARDAAGAVQTARLEVHRENLIRISVEDDAAVYPLLIDPLVTGEGFAAAALGTEQDYASFGESVAGAGDVNGDGYDDVIVGAPAYDAGEPDEGAAFIFLGGPTGVGNGSPETADTRIVSDDAGAFLGGSVAGAGDVNGDGYDDVIVGARGYGFPGSGSVPVAGAAFVFLGGPDGVDDASPSTADARLESDQYSQLGYSVAGAGDVNGDGYDDVIVGDPSFDGPEEDEGAAFIFLGGAGGIVSGSAATAASRLESNQSYRYTTGGLPYFAASVAGAGDVNGDGYDDVVVGAPEYKVGASDHAGAAFLFLGGSGGIASGNPDTASAQILQGSSTGFLGSDVAGAGDVNADGYDDVIVSALSGGIVALVYLGGSAGIDGSHPAATLTSHPSDLLLQLGTSVSGAGDVNADGYDDVVVGGAYVFLGGPTGVADGSPTTAAAPLVFGERLGDAAGAGDVNGDGFDDAIVSAPWFAQGDDDVQAEGAAFVFQGNTCGNGIDDDGDGLVDAPSDPGCAGAADLSERGSVACDDGIDRDGDDLVDYPGDPGCTSPADDSEREAGLACDNGIDDDEDGAADFPADPGCADVQDPSERGTAICDDGVDNDGDTTVDYPFDPGCEDLGDPSELGDAVCDNGFDDDGDGKVDHPDDPECRHPQDASEQPVACDDGVDNDGDGLTDHVADPGCAGTEDGSERGTAVCDDGADDDGDGAADYPADSGCRGVADLSEGESTCDNGADDDGDDASDFPSDPGCQDVVDDSERGTLSCDNGLDDNGNGFADYPDDPACDGPSDPFEATAFTDGASHVIDAGTSVPDDAVGVGPVQVCGLPLARQLERLGYGSCYLDPTELLLESGGTVGFDLIVIGPSSVEIAGGTVGGNVRALPTPCPYFPFCDTGAPLLTITSGLVAGSIEAYGTELDLRGGTVEGRVRAYDAAQPLSPFPGLPIPEAVASKLALLGSAVGGVELHGTSQAIFTGESVDGDFETFGDSAARVSGGRLAGALVLHDRSLVEIVGEFDGLESGDVAVESGRLHGELADGTPIDVDFVREPGATLRVIGRKATGVIDDFESGSSGVSSFGEDVAVDRWLLPARATLGGVRSLRIHRETGHSAGLTVSEGELRLTASDFRGSAAATGWVAYDGIPNDVFDGTQGQLFADLTGAGAFDRLLIELGEYSAAFAVEVEVSDGDSSASRSQGPFGAGLEVVAFEFNLFPGIDFSDVRALSVSIFTIAQRGAQVSVARIALGPCVGVCTSGTTQLDREERACVNAINRDWAHVLGRQSRDNVKCVEDAASGKLPIDQCLGQDLGGKVEKARKRTRRTEAAKCEPIGMPGPDDFGFTDNMTANEAASTAALDAFRSVFGDVPALAEEEIDPQGAACQREVVQQLGHSMDLWARELNHGKRAALRGASDGAPPVANPRDLASVIDATIAAIQLHGRIEKAKGRVHARITKQCDGVAIDGLFDCVGLDSCVVGRAFQAACESMELADGLELDCRPVVVLGL